MLLSITLHRVPDGLRTVYADVSTTITIQQLAERLQLPHQDLRFVHKGRVLRPEKSLGHYHVQSNDTIYYYATTRPHVTNQPAYLEMLNSPVMESIYRDPDFLMMMMDTNPTIRALRQRSPELNVFFSDPQVGGNTQNRLCPSDFAGNIPGYEKSVYDARNDAHIG